MYKQLNNDELPQIFLYPLILYYLRLTGKLVLLTIAKNKKYLNKQKDKIKKPVPFTRKEFQMRPERTQKNTCILV